MLNLYNPQSILFQYFLYSNKYAFLVEAQCLEVVEKVLQSCNYIFKFSVCFTKKN